MSRRRIYTVIGFYLIIGGLSSSGYALDFATPHIFSYYIVNPTALRRHDLRIETIYTYTDFKTYWGITLEELEERDDHLSGNNHVDFTHQMLQTRFTYGITNRLFLGVAVPWKKVYFRRSYEGVQGLTSPGGFQDSSAGIGDVSITISYTVLKELDPIIPFSWTIGASTNLPTGDTRQIRVAGMSLGSGTTTYNISTSFAKDFRTMVIGGGVSYNIGGKADLGLDMHNTSYRISLMFLKNLYQSERFWGMLVLDTGYSRVPNDLSLDTLDYRLTLKKDITQNFSLSGCFFGQSFVNWEDISGTQGVVDTSTLDIYDVGLALQYRVRTMTFDLGLVYDLNDDFVRAKFQPTIGISYVF